MLIERLRKYLTTPTDSLTSPRAQFWLLASLIVGGICAYLGVRGAFRGFIAQDDARQVVFWMRRFMDPELFPQDIIADYYQAVTPFGFSSLYRGLAMLGVDPVLANKLLPVFLGLATTGYCFLLSMQLFPVPAAAFIASALMNQALWQRLDISSATPRAFLYPLLLALLFHLFRRDRVACLIIIALSGLFYPPLCFIVAGTLILSMVRWNNFRPRLTRERGDWVFCGIALALILLTMLAFALASSKFGPTITAAEARELPYDLAGKRLRFLRLPFWDYWIWNGQTGLLANLSPLPVALAAGAFLPLFWLLRRRIPLAGAVSERISVLPAILATAMFMFFAAHLLLFKLYLPNRYTKHSFLLVAPLLAGISLTLMLETVLQWAANRRRIIGSASAIAATVLIASLLATYPLFVDRFPMLKWAKGTDASLYTFLGSQPKDIVIATLSKEGNNIPIFSKRTVLVGQEFANPYQKNYYLELRQRFSDLLHAHYSSNIDDLKNFIKKYKVDYLVLDNDVFTIKYVASSRPLRRFRGMTREISANLVRGVIPALEAVRDKCIAFDSGKHVVLDARQIVALDEKGINH